MDEKQKPKKIILDTSLLIARPDVLSLSSPDTKFVITEPVFREVMNYPLSGSGSSFMTAIEQAINVGTIQYAESPKRSFVWPLPPGTPTRGAISAADLQILSYASTYQNDFPQEEVLIATEDKKLAEYAAKAGIKVINGTKLSEMMLKVGKRVNEISGQVKSAIRSQRFSTGISFVAGVVSTVLASLVYSNLQWILQTANVWATLLGILVLSVLFFWLRARFRLYYGIAEFGVGLVLCRNAFGPGLKT